MEADLQRFRVDPEQIKIEKRVQIRTEQESVDWRVVGNSSIWGDVSSLHDVEQFTSANHAFRAVAIRQGASRALGAHILLRVLVTTFRDTGRTRVRDLGHITAAMRIVALPNFFPAIAFAQCFRVSTRGIANALGSCTQR